MLKDRIKELREKNNLTISAFARSLNISPTSVSLYESGKQNPGKKTIANIRKVLMQLVNGTYSANDTELFRDLYNSLLNTQCTAKADTYFILKDFDSYAETQKKIQEAYKDTKKWNKMAILNVASSGKFSSDRTIQEYVDDIWHL